MVRLERILYEKVLNNRFLGRQRIITHPTKINGNEERNLRTFPLTSMVAKFLPDTIYLWFFSTVYRWHRYCYITRGLSFDDYIMQSEDDIRRDPIWEHMVRENMHPYHFMLPSLRRQRFWKVDLGLDGFYPHEEIQNEARSIYFLRIRDKLLEWRRVRNLYHDEMIPMTRWTYGRFVGVLDFLAFTNLFLRMGWNRYFFNEEHYAGDNVILEELRQEHGRVLPLEQMKARLENFNEKCPGILAPDGEKINWEQFEKDIASAPGFIHTTPEGDTEVDIIGNISLIYNRKELPRVEPVEPELVERPNMVGTTLPAAIDNKVGTAFM